MLVTKYTLPDGRQIKIGRERFEAAEALFNPSVVDNEKPGMANMVFDMIQDAEVDLRKDFYEHIVLSGGTTMYPGLPSRLERDIRARYLEDVARGDARRMKRFKLRIEDPPRRKFMVFMGGSVLSEIMKDRDEFWVSKAQYEENGLRVCDRLGKGK